MYFGNLLINCSYFIIYSNMQLQYVYGSIFIEVMLVDVLKRVK